MERIETDLAIYGGTAGGIAAAVQAARMGKRVVLIEPGRHLGGMMSGGLSWIDVRGRHCVGGLSAEFLDEVTRRYAAQGIDLEKFGNEGCSVEPHVAEQILRDWLDAAGDRVRLVPEHRLAAVTKEGTRLRSLTLDYAPPDDRHAPTPEPRTANALEVRAAMFIDASYEGDLMAGAGVSHRRDREGAGETGESRAGVRHPFSEHDVYLHNLALDPYVVPGDPDSGLLPFISDAPLPPEGSASPMMQAYNFRLCLTDRDPLPIAPPVGGYDPTRFELVGRYLAAMQASDAPLDLHDLTFRGEHLPHPRLLKITLMMKHKADLNNAGPVSTDFVGGGSERYAEATWAERSEIWHAHEDYLRGFFQFLQTDPRVPADLQTEVRRWGLPRDEFTDTGGWPHQLYIRECRRMVGVHVMRESDCASPRPLTDTVGIGTYSLDSHLVQRLVHEGKHFVEGGFYEHLDGPYPIPYGVITPRAAECENLLVTFCVSATHVAFDSLRMEPVCMVLSQSAATAACLALDAGTSVQAVDRAALRARLEADGQVLAWPVDAPAWRPTGL